MVCIPFHDGVGTTASDLSGHGHPATLEGDIGWGSGFVRVHGGPTTMIRLAGDPVFWGPSFSYDLWLEADTIYDSGRLVAQAPSPGGAGPQLFTWFGPLALRIDNTGTVFDQPTVGTRTNDGPPDHWGQSADLLHAHSGPEHVVVTHDGPSQMVRMFLGLEGQPLRLTFEAHYTGSYSVEQGPLIVANMAGGDRVFRGDYFQFAYYDRALSFSVDGNRNVTGGEVHANHIAGSDADCPLEPGSGGSGGHGGGGASGGGGAGTGGTGTGGEPSAGGAGGAVGPGGSASPGGGGATGGTGAAPADDGALVGSCGCTVPGGDSGRGELLLLALALGARRRRTALAR